MPENVAGRKRTRYRRERTRVLWITIAIFGLMLVAATILIASTDSYEWLP